MKYRLAIFDFDGTLVSSLDAIAECMSDALTAFGYRAPSRDEVRTTVGLTLEESVAILTKRKASAAQLTEIVKFYREQHETKGAALVRLFDGATKLLERLPAHGIKSVLVSNKGRKALNQILERLKIWAFFDLSLSAEDVDCNKPDPKLFTRYIAPQFADIAKAETIMIGDTALDIQFAKAAGLASCWVRYGYGDPAKCQKLKPDHTVANLHELEDVLRGAG
jgi:phosphoglycolate phosphatase